MRYFTELKVTSNAKELYDVLYQETFDDKRSKLTLELKDDLLKIFIENKDANALRASFNSVARLIQVFEKAKSVE